MGCIINTDTRIIVTKSYLIHLIIIFSAKDQIMEEIKSNVPDSDLV